MAIDASTYTRLLTPVPLYCSTGFDTANSPNTMSRSFLGSVRDKLSRRPSASQSNKMGVPPAIESMPETRQTRAGPVELPASVPVNRSTNPFSNPSPPTRRPAPIEPPPAYSASPNANTGLPYNPASLAPGASSRQGRDASPALSIASVTTSEDPYAFLATFDTLFVIDDSGSMAGRSWREVREALNAITPICVAHDSDGIDLFFLNHKTDSPANAKNGKSGGGYRGIRDVAAIDRVFSSVRPGGGTPTGTTLHKILRPYLQLCADNESNLDVVKPINIIVITDGCPSDDVESVLVSAAKKLDKIDAPPYQVGVQFFQVGCEPGAREALRELDDGIAEMVEGGVRDMVDTVTWEVQRDGDRPVLTAEGILKTVLGAVVRRLDRRR